MHSGMQSHGRHVAVIEYLIEKTSNVVPIYSFCISLTFLAKRDASHVSAVIAVISVIVPVLT